MHLYQVDPASFIARHHLLPRPVFNYFYPLAFFFCLETREHCECTCFHRSVLADCLDGICARNQRFHKFRTLLHEAALKQPSYVCRQDKSDQCAQDGGTQLLHEKQGLAGLPACSKYAFLGQASVEGFVADPRNPRLAWRDDCNAKSRLRC